MLGGFGERNCFDAWFVLVFDWFIGLVLFCLVV